MICDYFCRVVDAIAECAGTVRENVQLRRAHRCMQAFKLTHTLSSRLKMQEACTYFAVTLMNPSSCCITQLCSWAKQGHHHCHFAQAGVPVWRHCVLPTCQLRARAGQNGRAGGPGRQQGRPARRGSLKNKGPSFTLSSSRNTL